MLVFDVLLSFKRKPGPYPRLDALQAGARRCRERFSVKKNHAAQQAVAGYFKAVFGFRIYHLRTAEPALYVAATCCCITVPLRTWQVQVFRSAAQYHPIIIPEGQYVI